MSDIVTPDDPNFNKNILPPTSQEPIVMGGNAEDLTPKGASKKSMEEMDKLKESEVGSNFKYASSTIAHHPDPWVKTAQATGVSNMMTNPMWFSPLHTPQAWQTASKRREIYQWSFISQKTPCYLTKYGDYDVIDIKDVYTNSINNKLKLKELYIQNSNGEQSPVDKVTRRYIEKKANKIKCLSTQDAIEVTHDHKCIVLKREDVKCIKRGKNTSKNCICGKSSPTCLSYNCDRYKDFEYKISKLNAEDVKKGDYFLVPFPTKIKESAIKTVEEARFAGHLAADGSVSPERKSARICMNRKEIPYVYPTIEKVFTSYFAPAMIEGKREHVCEVRTGVRSLSRFACSLVRGKAENKRFTEEVLFLDPKLQKHVLGAYIQSDGYYNAKTNTVSIQTVSPHLCNQLMIMFYRCGVLAFCSKQKISSSEKTFKTKNLYRYVVSLSRSNCYTFKNYVPGKMGNCYPVERRHNKRFFWKNYVVTPVVSNESFDYEGPVYDVRAPKNFTVTANGIAIHQCRFFFSNEPKVKAAIQFYSEFALNGFKLVCKSEKIAKWYDKHIVKRLKLNEIFNMMSREYFMLGDVFVHTDVQCPVCSGAGVDPETGKPCNHPDGTFRRIVILNPDWIEVQKSPMADEASIIMIPDDELRRIIMYRQPKIIYDRIPDYLKKIILANQPIPLSNRTTSHLKHLEVPYSSYGTSMIRCLFTTLAYKTKIMTANWIVAERLILPVRVVKVGSDDRPASSADIADIQSQLAATANDPNLTIVTHHNFDYSWYGACHDELTEVLTDSGFKTYDQVDIRRDKVMCYDVYTKSTKCIYPTQKHVYNYDGDMIHFNGKRLDIMVTPNHKMLVKWDGDKERRPIKADEVKHGMRFLSVSKFECDGYEYPVIELDNELFVEISNEKIIELDKFAEFVGYYLSEGTLSCKKSNYRVQAYQKKKPSSIKIQKSFASLGYNDRCYKYADTNQFTISSKELAIFIRDNFGHGAHLKYIPTWMKNLPIKYLQILLEALLLGDGYRQETKIESFVYTSTSNQLSDDVQEIATKLGYASRKYKGKMDGSWGTKQIYRVNISRGKNSNGSEPVVRKNHISRCHYKGKVWCFTVPTGYFVTRRNGKITIQGNSGKILQVTQELEYIGKEVLDGFMLNQALLNGEMCLTKDHGVLTSAGYKSIAEISKEDSICVWNSFAQCFSYEKPKQIFKYENVEKVYEIKSGDKVLFKCTKDHKIVLADYYDDDEGYCRKVSAEDLCIYNLESTFYKTILKDGTQVRITSVEKVDYNDTVYCFETSTGFFVAKYNDVEFISSNSGYQSAQVGVEVLIRRLQSWRHTLAEWAEENIFKPVAEMQGFIDEKESAEQGETVYLYPTIDWNDLNLKDQTQWHNILMQLHDKQVISTQTLCEEMDLDYDQEIERLRYEQTVAGPMGGMLGAGGAMGAGGGMDMLGGGMGGMPAGPGGPGGAMGGEIGMGGDMGAAGVGGVGAGGGMPAPMAGTGGKIMKKGKGEKKEQEVDPEQMGFIRLTKVEQKMAAILEDLMKTNMLKVGSVRIQYPMQNPTGGKSYTLDFAVPNLKLGVEADGEIAHSSEEQIQHDKQRDYYLARRGWTVLRFDDQAIDESPHLIKQTIVQYVKQLSQPKKVASTDQMGEIGLFKVKKEKIYNLLLGSTFDEAWKKYWEI